MLRSPLKRHGRCCGLVSWRISTFAPAPLVHSQLVDYVNYVRDYDDSFRHPTAGSAKIVTVWREVYHVSGATGLVAGTER